VRGSRACELDGIYRAEQRGESHALTKARQISGEASVAEGPCVRYPTATGALRA
jgi:hypothetical protein